MLSVIVIFFERIQDYLEVFFIIDEIGIAGIHEQGLDIVLLDIMRVGFLQIEQVIITDILFVGAVALADIRLQFGDRCMQIDQDIRLDQLLMNDIEKPLVKPELIFR